MSSEVDKVHYITLKKKNKEGFHKKNRRKLSSNLGDHVSEQEYFWKSYASADCNSIQRNRGVTCGIKESLEEQLNSYDIGSASDPRCSKYKWYSANYNERRRMREVSASPYANVNDSVSHNAMNDKNACDKCKRAVCICKFGKKQKKWSPECGLEQKELKTGTVQSQRESNTFTSGSTEVVKINQENSGIQKLQSCPNASQENNSKILNLQPCPKTYKEWRQLKETMSSVSKNQDDQLSSGNYEEASTSKENLSSSTPDSQRSVKNVNEKSDLAKPAFSNSKNQNGNLKQQRNKNSADSEACQISTKEMHLLNHNKCSQEFPEKKVSNTSCCSSDLVTSIMDLMDKHISPDVMKNKLSECSNGKGKDQNENSDCDQGLVIDEKNKVINLNGSSFKDKLTFVKPFKREKRKSLYKNDRNLAEKALSKCKEKTSVDCVENTQKNISTLKQSSLMNDEHLNVEVRAGNEVLTSDKSEQSTAEDYSDYEDELSKQTSKKKRKRKSKKNQKPLKGELFLKANKATSFITHNVKSGVKKRAHVAFEQPVSTSNESKKLSKIFEDELSGGEIQSSYSKECMENNPSKRKQTLKKNLIAQTPKKHFKKDQNSYSKSSKAKELEENVVKASVEGAGEEKTSSNELSDSSKNGLRATCGMNLQTRREVGEENELLLCAVDDLGKKSGKVAIPETNCSQDIKKQYVRIKNWQNLKETDSAIDDGCKTSGSVPVSEVTKPPELFKFFIETVKLQDVIPRQNDTLTEAMKFRDSVKIKPTDLKKTLENNTATSKECSLIEPDNSKSVLKGKPGNDVIEQICHPSFYKTNSLCSTAVHDENCFLKKIESKVDSEKENVSVLPLITSPQTVCDLLEPQEPVYTSKDKICDTIAQDHICILQENDSHVNETELKQSSSNINSNENVCALKNPSHCTRKNSELDHSEEQDEVCFLKEVGSRENFGKITLRNTLFRRSTNLSTVSAAEYENAGSNESEVESRVYVLKFDSKRKSNRNIEMASSSVVPHQSVLQMDLSKFIEKEIGQLTDSSLSKYCERGNQIISSMLAKHISSESAERSFDKSVSIFDDGKKNEKKCIASDDNLHKTVTGSFLPSVETVCKSSVSNFNVAIQNVFSVPDRSEKQAESLKTGCSESRNITLNREHHLCEIHSQRTEIFISPSKQKNKIFANNIQSVKTVFEENDLKEEDNSNDCVVVGVVNQPSETIVIDDDDDDDLSNSSKLKSSSATCQQKDIMPVAKKRTSIGLSEFTNEAEKLAPKFVNEEIACLENKEDNVDSNLDRVKQIVETGSHLCNENKCKELVKNYSCHEKFVQDVNCLSSASSRNRSDFQNMPTYVSSVQADNRFPINNKEHENIQPKNKFNVSSTIVNNKLEGLGSDLVKVLGKEEQHKFSNTTLYSKAQNINVKVDLQDSTVVKSSSNNATVSSEYLTRKTIKDVSHVVNNNKSEPLNTVNNASELSAKTGSHNLITKCSDQNKKSPLSVHTVAKKVEQSSVDEGGSLSITNNETKQQQHLPEPPNLNTAVNVISNHAAIDHAVMESDYLPQFNYPETIENQQAAYEAYSNYMNQAPYATHYIPVYPFCNFYSNFPSAYAASVLNKNFLAFSEDMKQDKNQTALQEHTIQAEELPATSNCGEKNSLPSTSATNGHMLNEKHWGYRCTTCMKEAVLACGKCKKFPYCSKECALIHWRNEHYRYCRI